MKKIILALMLLGLQLLSAQQTAIGLNINSDELEIEGRTALSFGGSDPMFRNFYIDANFINTDDTFMGVGLFVENRPTGHKNITFAIGLRGIFTDHDKKDFTAVPIYVGAKARMYIKNIPITHFGVKLAYAPNPLTFNDASSYLEYRVEADMNIIDNVNIYIGYRDIDTKYEKSDYDTTDTNFNNSFYIGFKFVF